MSASRSYENQGENGLLSAARFTCVGGTNAGEGRASVRQHREERMRERGIQYWGDEGLGTKNKCIEDKKVKVIEENPTSRKYKVGIS